MDRFLFKCSTCGENHEPCVDMAHELKAIEVTLRQIIGPKGDGKSPLEMIEMLRERAYKEKP